MRVACHPGIALFAALSLTALLALLIAGAVATTRLAQRSAHVTRADATLSAATDYALNSVLARPADYGVADMRYGQTTVLSVSAASADAPIARVGVTRLANGVVWIVADATSASADGGHRRFNLVARYPVLPLPPAAIVARSGVRLGSAVAVTADTWSEPDCPTTAAGAAALLPDAGALDAPSGIPAVAGAAASDSSTYYLTAVLATLADSVGVRRVRGDTILAGSYAGVLFVDGSVTIAGAFALSGLLVVTGRVDASQGRLDVTGALMAFGAPSGGRSIDVASGSFVYSPCTIARANRRAASLRRVPYRSWAELF